MGNLSTWTCHLLPRNRSRQHNTCAVSIGCLRGEKSPLREVCRATGAAAAATSMNYISWILMGRPMGPMGCPMGCPMGFGPMGFGPMGLPMGFWSHGLSHGTLLRWDYPWDVPQAQPWDDTMSRPTGRPMGRPMNSPME